MGMPEEISASNVNTNYNWGEFGGADSNRANLSPMATSTVRDTQAGINQYINELINPSYNNASFQARQSLLDQSNRQYATQLGAQAIARGARGSATQSILNSIAANRNNNMRSAMTSEDQRVQNILSALSGIEGNYWQQANAMADNALKRESTNAGYNNAVNAANTAAYNAWRNNLISGAASVAGGAIGGPLGAYMAGQLANNALGSGEVSDVNGNYLGRTGGYGVYDPNFKQY